jgi:rhodanese-related sulfurtransferase
VLVLAAAAVLTGCASGNAEVSPTQTYTAIVDVRTPEEFAAGHVVGAVNIDVQSSTFDSDIAKLPREGVYLVYCRSGNRSAAAAADMRADGLVVLDGGGLDDMKNAGFPFTT